MVVETVFTPVAAIIGGAMIGLAALVLMWSLAGSLAYQASWLALY